MAMATAVGFSTIVMSERRQGTKDTDQSDETLASTAESESGSPVVNCSSPVLHTTSCNNLIYSGSVTEPCKKLQQVNSVSDGGGLSDNSPRVLLLDMPSRSSSSCITKLHDISQDKAPLGNPRDFQKDPLFSSQTLQVEAIRTLRPSSSSDHDRRSTNNANENQPTATESPCVSLFAEAATADRDTSVLSHISKQASSGPLPASTRLGVAALSSTPLGSQERQQTFWEYLYAETHPGEKLPTMDVVWGQTERDRVYNFLIYVPYQLERMIQFSFLLCADCVLGVVTLLPLRCAVALRTLWCLLPRRSRGSPPSLSGSQVFDLICLLILASATWSLCIVPPGFIYYWLKDIIVNEFLKMSFLSASLEILERIVSNFGLDVMEALSGTCTLWVMGRRQSYQLICDSVIAFAIVLLHAVILMCLALVIAMALNSKRNGLVGLLIASNFVELKANVFKRWDVERIRNMVFMDVVERFQLICILWFVVVEDMDSGATWAPSSTILWEALRILCAEVVIDVTKHAVLGKFNDVRPGIYREYMKDLCDKVTSSQSHNMQKNLGFHHLACCALLLRSAVTLFHLRLGTGLLQVTLRITLVALLWLSLLPLKVLLGYALKCVAFWYSQSYYSTHHVRAFARASSAVSSRVSLPSGVLRKEAGAAMTASDLGGQPEIVASVQTNVHSSMVATVFPQNLSTTASHSKVE
ncbi:hypothetical protein CEUSTIGMA_g5470.t1 [Chlamydomonas eustigma]|uniref:Transmembrane protein n=1 Tax=Chlamydomonas eustigma TaxID=1157962 RepID=A0A250X4M8_9CHLO|nr:hypothetical protein CEUSTIGMA_g5470.t1 [Chlamydomonas eustigma]|eukprot:GAX78028.1 hypothetical protein CEUSTIGMA_g5470.t1 [Chlamydomonas eustigma]